MSDIKPAKTDKKPRKPIKRLSAESIQIVKLALAAYRPIVENAPEHPLVDKAAMLQATDKAIAHFA